MPKVSIIITTHNRPHLLTRAIESARASGRDVETVVVDDASTDHTADVCKGISGIRYVRVDRNQKVAGARDIGILASSGDYLSFLDDDDVRLTGSLDIQLEALEAAPDAGMIYGQAIVENQRNGSTSFSYPQRCPEGDIFWELLSQNFIPCGTVVFRRSCLSSVGLLDAELPGIDDWDLWIRIAEVYPIIALSQPVMIWRRSTPMSTQGTSKANELVTLSARQFQTEWMRLPRAASGTRTQRREVWREFSSNMTKHLISETAAALSYGCFAQARRNVQTLLMLQPSGLFQAISRASISRRVSENEGNSRI